jgi:propanol-preferring alcohol dehydrogenase
MKAMVIDRIASLKDQDAPLSARELPVPEPGAGEIRIKISACGVCHTELDEIEGRTAPPRLPVVPGHEVVGRLDKRGAGATRFDIGERVGVGWIHSSSGSADENLSPGFRATGRDVDGGYAEYMTVPETYAYPIPDEFSDADAAPLLCAGGVGYRSLKLARISDGQTLGLTGFGGSAHLVLQLARHLGRRYRGALSRDVARHRRYHASLEAGSRGPGQLTAGRSLGDQRHPQGGRR